MASKNMSKRIAEMRVAKGFTASELARRVGVSPPAVAGWEGGSIPRSKVLDKLASALDVSSEFLTTGKTVAVKGPANNVAQIIAQAEVSLAHAMGYEPGRVRIRFDLVEEA